jgi:NADPH2:quinone reductase
MRAIVCSRFGGPEVLELADVEVPLAREGQVILDVHACAINFPDLLMVQGLYQIKPDLPFTPGSEVAGVIRSLGVGVEGMAVGDRVIASTGTGGLAEQVVVDAKSVVPAPEGIDFASAAGLLYTYGTSYHALRDRAVLQPGETLLVLGAAGGVGLAAVELGRLMGARVIAAASSEEKLALCREYGAAETVNYGTEDLKTRVRELTGGVGADVVYDPVGGGYTEPALRATAWNGRYLVVGFASGVIPRIPLNLPLLRGCSLVGVYWGSFVQSDPGHHHRNLAELVGWWRSGRLKPHVSGTYPLERAVDAMRHLAERQALGKLIVTVT